MSVVCYFCYVVCTSLNCRMSVNYKHVCFTWCHSVNNNAEEVCFDTCTFIIWRLWPWSQFIVLIKWHDRDVLNRTFKFFSPQKTGHIAKLLWPKLIRVVDCRFKNRFTIIYGCIKILTCKSVIKPFRNIISNISIYVVVLVYQILNNAIKSIKNTFFCC